MFTPYMTDEELQAAAYQDFLEIQMKVKLALEKFTHNLKLRSGQRRMIHSVMETHTIRTKARNTWNICFINDTYNPQIDGMFFANYFVYYPLHRGENVDFLFMYIIPDFKLERLSAHFLQRYKERYLDYNQVNLRGMHPALYYMFKNQDRTQATYLPANWTEEDLKEKCFVISSQGLSLIKINGKVVTYITFLDQENLSRYKAQVYEEETFWKDFQKFDFQKMEASEWHALYKKLYSDPEKAKDIFFRFFRRKGSRNKEKLQEYMKIFEENWDKFIEFQGLMSECWTQIKKEEQPKDLYDVGMKLTKKIKKGDKDVPKPP